VQGARPGPTEPDATAPPPAAERHSLLGSAWKIKAMLLARRITAARTFSLASSGSTRPDAEDAATAQALEEAIARAAEAYRAATRPTPAPDFDSYPALNRLALEPLRGPLAKAARAEALRLVRECAVAARAKAARSVEPWAAVMTVEAMWVESMLDGRFAAEGAAGERELQRLQETYAALLRTLTLKPSQLGSVTGQHTKLHLLWCALARVDKARNAEARRVAERLLALAQSIDANAVEVGGAGDGRWWRNQRPSTAATARSPSKPARVASGKKDGKAAGKALGKRPRKTPRKPARR